MHGIPAGYRDVGDFRIVELTFENKPNEFHCFGYEDFGFGPYVWSTAIKLESLIYSETACAFQTKSGSRYSAHRFTSAPIPDYPGDTRLQTWFNADGFRVVSKEEWAEVLKEHGRPLT